MVLFASSVRRRPTGLTRLSCSMRSIRSHGSLAGSNLLIHRGSHTWARQPVASGTRTKSELWARAFRARPCRSIQHWMNGSTPLRGRPGKSASSPGPQRRLATNSNPRISFSVVRIPDTAILSMLVYDLRHGIADLAPAPDKLLKPDSDARSDGFPEIAILSDNTAYGRAAGAARSIRRMAFPLHISDLRTAYSRMAPTLQPPGTITSRSEIPIADETGQDDNDTVPRFSARTAAYNELVLEPC